MAMRLLTRKGISDRRQSAQLKAIWDISQLNFFHKKAHAKPGKRKRSACAAGDPLLDCTDNIARPIMARHRCVFAWRGFAAR